MRRRRLSTVLILLLLMNLWPARYQRLVYAAPPSTVEMPAELPTEPSDRVELLDRRTSSMKVFETPDGLQYQLFAGPVHYPGANGKWVEYKPDFAERKEGGNRSFHASGVPFTAGFTPNGDKHEVTFQHKGTGLRFQVEAENSSGPGAPVRSGRSLRFDRAADKVAYQYDLQKNGLKETILLLHPPTTNTFRFPVTFEGVNPWLQEDGSIVAVDEAGAIRWRIAAPFAVDDAGSRAPSVTQQVEEANGAQTLVITVDDEWLRDPARQWPVQVDPTVVIEPDPADGMDVGLLKQTNQTAYKDSNGKCHVYQPRVTYLANGTSMDELIYVSTYHATPPTCSGLSYGQSETNTSNEYYGLLKFGLSALPKGASVKRAYLNLWTSPETSKREGTLAAVTTPWEETSLLPLRVIPEAYVLYDRAPIILDGWTQFDITTLTDRWINGEQPNYGLRLGSYRDGLSYSFVTSVLLHCPTDSYKRFLCQQLSLRAPIAIT